MVSIYSTYHFANPFIVCPHLVDPFTYVGRLFIHICCMNKPFETDVFLAKLCPRNRICV